MASVVVIGIFLLFALRRVFFFLQDFCVSYFLVYVFSGCENISFACVDFFCIFLFGLNIF